MQLRKLASTAVGALLAGATLAVPALGASLDDLPSPFVSDGEADFTIVVGADANAADIVGAVDIAARLGGETVTTESAAAGEGQEDVELGEVLSTEFGTTLDDDDVGVLQDTSIGFDSENWDVHDEIRLASTGPALETSLSSNEEDYKAAPVMEITAKGDIAYYYLFDEAINLSARVDSDTELEIDFLGKQLTISSITDADTMKAQVGEEIDLDAGESATVEGKVVTLIQTSSSDAKIDVDGTTGVIAEGSTKTVNGLEIKVDTIFDDEGSVDDSAILIVGEDAEKTYDNNDEYIDFCSTTGGDDDCDEDNPDWVWVLNGLTTLQKGDVTAGGGPTIGIQNDFVQDANTKEPLLEGETLWLPHDFAKIAFEDLVADDFVKVTIEFNDAIDVSDADFGGINFGTSEDGFLITADVEESLVLEDLASGWNASYITADVSTEKIALILNESAMAIQVFYWDTNNDEVLAGNLSILQGADALAAGLDRFGFVDFKDTTGSTRMPLALNISNESADNQFFLGFMNNDTEVADEATDDLFIQMGTAALIDRGTGTAAFDSLGPVVDDSETGELLYGRSSNSTAPNTLKVGTRDEDQLTAYGVKVGDPDSNGASDKVILWVPGDRQEGRITIGSSATVTAAGERSGQITTSVSKLDTETTAESEGNLILVGGPCANSLVAQLADADKYGWTCDESVALGGSGYTIEIVEDAFADGQVALIVAGQNADDTRDAASRVQTFDTDGLTGMSVRTGVYAA
ncbi:MAG: S-layer protein [Candidatus Aenigmatarchaeota archaeon]|nr:MAG: S-layer protein [Candidatus Aenigmarchaeota archaeon]